MACPNCAKNKSKPVFTMKIATIKDRDFVLKYYIGANSTVQSNQPNLFYTDLVKNQQYYVHVSDINETLWSDSPIVDDTSDDENGFD